LTAVPSDFEKIRADINTFEREAMEISSPRALGKKSSPSLSREQLVHLVGLLWKLSSAYKDYARLLEQSLVDIRQNMEEGEDKKTLEDTAMNLDQLIDGLQKIENLAGEFEE
jgi:hypothetical protein